MISRRPISSKRILSHRGESKRKNNRPKSAFCKSRFIPVPKSQSKPNESSDFFKLNTSFSKLNKSSKRGLTSRKKCKTSRKPLYEPPKKNILRKKKEKFSRESAQNQKKKQRKKKIPKIDFGYRTKEDTAQQKLKIEKLTKENELLMKQIDEYNEKTNSFSEIKLKLNKLNDLADEFIQKIELEKKDVAKYERILSNIERQIQKEKSQNGTKKNQLKIVENQKRTLENRLEYNLKKLNMIVCENKRNKQKIIKLRNERRTFNKIYKKIEKDLIDTKKEISQMIEKSNKEYEERDEINKEIEKAKQKKSKELWVYKQKFLELDRIVEEESNFQKKVKTLEKKKKEKAEKRHQLHKKNLLTTWNLFGGKASSYAIKEKIENFRTLFKKIETETNLTIDEMINNLKKEGKINYSTFLYINKLNSEHEKMEKEIREIENEINQENQEKEKQKQVESDLSKLQEQINIIQDSESIYNKKISNLRSFYDTEVIVRVKKIAKLLGIFYKEEENEDSKPFEEDITFGNLTKFTGKIEEEVMKLLAKDSNSRVLIDLEPKVGKYKKIIPPSISEVTKGNEKPLDRKELLKTLENY